MRLSLSLAALAATALVACNNPTQSHPARGESVASSVCGKSAAVVGDQNWIDMGAAPTQVDLAVGCTLGQDGNTVGMACGDSNWTLHYADGTKANVTANGNQQYFSAGYTPTPASTQRFLVFGLESEIGAVNLPRGLGWSISANMLQNVDTSEALAAPMQKLGTDSNQATLTLQLVSDVMSKPVVFRATSGAVTVSAPKLGANSPVTLTASGIPLVLSEGYAEGASGYENAVLCPDQHLHVVADIAVTRTCEASLREVGPSTSPGYLQAKCETLTTTFGCADGMGPTSTDCCAKDPRWGDCSKETVSAAVCAATVVTGEGANNLFADCKVSDIAEFTCPIKVEGGVLAISAGCCAEDPRWAACGKQ